MNALNMGMKAHRKERVLYVPCMLHSEELGRMVHSTELVLKDHCMEMARMVHSTDWELLVHAEV